MGLNITSLREMIWRPLGMDDEDDTDLGTARIDLYLNRSFWEILDKFPFREKEKIATFPTEAGVRDYSIPSPIEALQSLSIVDDYNAHLQLAQITFNTYEDKYDSDDDQQDIPTEYTITGCFVRLWPTPDDVYVLTLKRLVTLTDLSESNAAPPIPQVWHEIIGFGGLWRAQLDFREYAAAQQIRAHQHALINSLSPREVKEKAANTQTAGLEVIRNEYGW